LTLDSGTPKVKRPQRFRMYDSDPGDEPVLTTDSLRDRVEQEYAEAPSG